MRFSSAHMLQFTRINIRFLFAFFFLLFNVKSDFDVTTRRSLHFVKKMKNSPSIVFNFHYIIRYINICCKRKKNHNGKLLRYVDKVFAKCFIYFVCFFLLYSMSSMCVSFNDKDIIIAYNQNNKNTKHT